MTAVLGLMAFEFSDWKSPEKDHAGSGQIVEKEDEEKIDTYTNIVYQIGPRHSPIKKSEIDQATDLSTFFTPSELQEINSLNFTEIIIVKNESQSNEREVGYSNKLTKAQLKLLQSYGYSTGFSIRADFEGINKETGEMESRWFNPHLTIVPETQAEYSEGADELASHFKENTWNVRKNVAAGNFRPAFVSFTVTTSGDIKDVKLHGSNFPAIDAKMIELIHATTGKWVPARNAKGEKVEQEIVVAFGPNNGC
ncbi:MAG: hypothetical protein ACI865_000092 [Flavobacteriaceae bacterium]|jgi:hypothetical protein